jgi:hypothetical protein
VRDTDGSLLVAVRPRAWEVADHFRVFRSTDDGATWRKHLDDPAMRAHSPVALSRTVSGWPILLANPLRRTCRRSDGAVMHASWMREDLQAFALTEDRGHVATPHHLFDARQMFGSARQSTGGHPNFWYVDHPAAGVFRLGDGRWHGLVPFRVCDLWEVCTDAAPADPSGFWLEELSEPGETATSGPWRFA